MRNFLAVAECGQFSRAAQRLHLSQPSLSASIKQLELRLGTELLIRHSRGVRLTPAGDAFLPRARAAIAAAETAVQAAQSHLPPPSLVVGFVPPWNLPAAEILGAYRQVAATVRTEVRQLTLADQSAAVRDARVDVALAWDPEVIPEVVIEVLRREPRMVCLAAAHPLARRVSLTLDDVADEPVPGVPPGIEQPVADALHLAHLRTCPIRYAATAAETVDETAALIAAGEAICMGPESLARAFVRPGLTVRPLLGVDPAEVSLVWREAETRPAVVRFIETAKRCAAQDIPPPEAAAPLRRAARSPRVGA